MGGEYYQFVFIPAWDSSPLLNFSPIPHPPPSTKDKLASALQLPPFNGLQCRTEPMLDLGCAAVVVFVCLQLLGRKVRVEVKVVWWE